MSNILRQWVKIFAVSVVFAVSVGVFYKLHSASAVGLWELSSGSPSDAKGQVLGAGVYNAQTLVSNKSLMLSVVPVGYSEGGWNYRIEWKRTKNAQGSIKVRKVSKVVQSQDLVEKSGSFETGFILDAKGRYNIEFYEKPNFKGILTARKYFNILAKSSYGYQQPIVCSYPAPSNGCIYVPGGRYNSSTNCGLILSCPQQPVACADDAKLCLDGKTYVGRKGPSCEFEVCPAVSSSSTSISTCRKITQSGDYVLAKDLTSSDACLLIESVKNVAIDCQGHSIEYAGMGPGAIWVRNTQGFSIQNCKLTGYRNTKEPKNVSFGIKIVNSSNGVISNNSLTGLDINTGSGEYEAINSFYSTNLEVRNNKFTLGLQQNYTFNSVIAGNTFEIPKVIGVAAAIISNNGGKNRIENNTEDGGWTGVKDQDSSFDLGADDGLVVAGEDGDVISGNTFANNWDCGIETLDLITNIKITGNIIRNSPICAIGAWYGNSWKGNTVSDNIAYNTSRLFYFFRLHSLKPGEATVYFKDNEFVNNKLVNPLSFSGQQDSMISFESVPQDIVGKLSLGNNKFTGNDLGQLGHIYFTPASMFVNGGGNVCAKGDPSPVCQVK